MEEFTFKKRHVPAFGSWDCNYDLEFTQCFESANQLGFVRCSYSEDRDLYVAGDLYENDVVTPTVIVVPRNTRKTRSHAKKKKDDWVVCDCELKAPVGAPPCQPAPKPVDEDLYKISPDLLRKQAKRKKAWSFVLSCLPTCLY